MTHPRSHPGAPFRPGTLAVFPRDTAVSQGRGAWETPGTSRLP